MSTPRKRAPRGSTATASRQSQRERLLGRPRPSLSYPLLVDPDGAQQARDEVDRVQREARQVMLREDKTSPAYKAARRQVEKAQQALDACYETIVLRALPTDGEVTAEGLLAAYPPTDKQVEQARAEREQARQRGDDLPPWPTCDEHAVLPVMLEASVDNGMSADDWRTFLAEHVSEGERRALWLACLTVNQRERVADPLVLPKGSTLTSSWR